MNKPVKRPEEMNEVELAYHLGYCHGLEAYAHWKDGFQSVGTTGKGLRQAQLEATETWNYKPPERVS